MDLDEEAPVKLVKFLCRRIFNDDYDHVALLTKPDLVLLMSKARLL